MKHLAKILLIILLGLTNKLFSQNDTLKNNVFGGFVIMPIEFPVIDNDLLNNNLSTLGFPDCDNPTANIGLGIQLYVNRFITTLSFNKTTKKVINDTYLTEVEYRSTSFNIGYDLTKSYKYSLYPYIGFKGCGINYLFREKVSTEISFNNYFQTNLRYQEITNSRANLDLGLGLSTQWFYLINLRIGYLLPIEEVRWCINNNNDKLTNSPTLKYNCYFTLTIGFGNIVSENDLRRKYNNER
jgi:hypothetical protein